MIHDTKLESKHIVFDVTHLIGWKGNLTGIPRTTDEIARRLKDDNLVEFVTWDTAIRDFVFVDIRYYYDFIDPVNRNFFKSNINKPTTSSGVDMYGFMLIKDKVRRRFPKTMSYAVKAKGKVGRLAKRAKKTTGSSHLLKGRYTPNKDDIFFIPCGTWDDNSYIRKVLEYKEKGSKLAFISYDLLPIVVPQFSGQWGEPMEDFTKRVTSRCDIVFSISQHTKTDLLEWLQKHKLKQPEVDVIHLGDTFAEREDTLPIHPEFKRSEISKNKDEFVLCTGTVEARKNHVLLYYVFKLAKSRGVHLPKLVIAGRPGHRTENIIEIIRDDPDVNERIFILDDVNDNELSWLYKNCLYSVYPSFYEGWGLPIAESIVQGVPCICSNTSSMTEVAPGIPDYFNPYSAEECLNLMVKYNDKNYLNKMRQKTKKYKKISWDVTYNQIIDSINRIGDKGA